MGDSMRDYPGQQTLPSSGYSDCALMDVSALGSWWRAAAAAAAGGADSSSDEQQRRMQHFVEHHQRLLALPCHGDTGVASVDGGLFHALDDLDHRDELVFYAPNLLDPEPQFKLPGAPPRQHHAESNPCWSMAAIEQTDDKLFDVDYADILFDWMLDETDAGGAARSSAAGGDGPVSSAAGVAPMSSGDYDSSIAATLMAPPISISGQHTAVWSRGAAPGSADESPLPSAFVVVGSEFVCPQDDSDDADPPRSSALSNSPAADDGGEANAFHRSRKEQLHRYREKKARRHSQPKVRYVLRKANADKRPRIKGRFIGRGVVVPTKPED